MRNDETLLDKEIRETKNKDEKRRELRMNVRVKSDRKNLK